MKWNQESCPCKIHAIWLLGRRRTLNCVCTFSLIAVHVRIDIANNVDELALTTDPAMFRQNMCFIGFSFFMANEFAEAKIPSNVLLP